MPAWIEPILNWVADRVVTTSDFNRIEGNIKHLKDTKVDNESISNVDNVKQMPMAGGEFTGIATAQSNTSYTVRQVRNIILSPNDAVLANMQDGDIWIKYK